MAANVFTFFLAILRSLKITISVLLLRLTHLFCRLICTSYKLHTSVLQGLNKRVTQVN